MSAQLIKRIFTKEPRKTRRVLWYMSKNMSMEEMVLDEADMQGWCVNAKADYESSLRAASDKQNGASDGPLGKWGQNRKEV